MTQPDPELEAISGQSTGNGELLFDAAALPRAIDLLNRKGVAILGIDLMRPTPRGLETLKLSSYEPKPAGRPWPEFVRLTHNLARAFADQTPAPPDSRYLLTTASESEFRQTGGGL